jgi:hypothetical protein
MFTKTQLRSFSEGIRIFVLFSLLITTFLAMPVLAEGDGPTVSVERLKGIYVGMKIVFPEDISGDLSAFINGVKMKCEVVPQNALYCVGPLRAKTFGNLTILDGTNNTKIFATTVAGPASNNQDGVECVPPHLCGMTQVDPPSLK